MSSQAYQHLHLTPNSDGTLTRPKEFYPTLPPSLSSSHSISKDVLLNPNNPTTTRLFLPRTCINGSDPHTKLPILVYLHGGGFVLASPGYPAFHEFCSVAACELHALVVSVGYRLAPEHRLPAAYDDVLEALSWVRDFKDEWVKDYGDLSRCVLAGESAGGNIAYHVGLMASNLVKDLQPLTIKGMVMIQPYFGGLERTGSELRLVDDSILPLFMNDFLWELALPLGADRSHEYCDPTKNGGSGLLDRVRDLGWWVAVVASYGDPLFDRDMELVRVMEGRGLRMKTMISKDDQHGVFVADSTNKRKDLLQLIRDCLY